MKNQNKEFLMWIHDRLMRVHHEDGDVDYMIKLRSIINDMPEELIPLDRPIKQNESEIKARKRTPLQSVYQDDHGTYRFVSNHIVRYLLDKGPFDMNHLACVSFSPDDRRQFAQLIGYSVSGYGDLSYSDEVTYSAAYQMMEEGLTEEQAKILHYEETIRGLQFSLRAPMAELFGKHPDDLLEVEDENDR